MSRSEVKFVSRHKRLLWVVSFLAGLCEESYPGHLCACRPWSYGNDACGLSWRSCVRPVPRGYSGDSGGGALPNPSTSTPTQSRSIRPFAAKQVIEMPLEPIAKARIFPMVQRVQAFANW